MAATDTVVVLGGTGFIGSEIVRQLRGKVRSVRVVSTRAGSLRTDDPGVEYVSGNVRDRTALDALTRGATVVQHLAREGDDGFEEGVRNVAEACLKHRIRRLVFASSSAALYLGDKGVIKEGSGPDPKPHLRHAYSNSKVKSEILLLRLQAEKGLPVVITRPSLVVGRGGRVSHGGIGDWPAPTCCIGWGNGKTPLPFVLVEDVADAHIRAMDAEGIDGRTFNLAGDVYLTGREYVRLVAERSLRNFRFFSRSPAWFYTSLQVKDLIKRVVGKKGEPAPTYREIKSLAMLTRIDNTLAKELLGWRPNADLDVFIREAIDANIQPVAPGDIRLLQPRGAVALQQARMGSQRYALLDAKEG